ncbi:MAG: hypothetical protein E6I75_18180 [Chloroflexi bacterium]|nr:MAG: hypothetical protein E6I75_18180 [Chloroflexota bacterium]
MHSGALRDTRRPGRGDGRLAPARPGIRALSASLSTASRGLALVEAARTLAPEIEAAAQRIEQDRQLPNEVVDALYAAGLFTMLLPASFGGAELDLPTFARAIEELARADGSVAWCVGQSADHPRALRERAHDLRQRTGRRQSARARGGGRRRLPRDGPLDVREWHRPRQLAPGGLPRVYAGWQSAARSRWQTRATPDTAAEE